MLKPLLVMTLTLAAIEARADRASDALHLLDTGIALYEQGDLEAARAAFVKARDLVPGKPNPHRWLGLVEARLHRCKEAIVELEWFIARVAPEDPRRVEAVAVRDRCHDQIAPPPGTLVVDSNPRGVYVRVDAPDGPVWLMTPSQNQLTEGAHTLFFSKTGFLGRSIEVKIERARMAPLYVELTPVAAPPATALVVPPAAATVDAPPPPRKRSRAWIAGVVVGVAVVGVALGVGLGVGLREPAPIALSPIMGEP